MPKQAISQTKNSVEWDWNLPKLFVRSCRNKGDRIKISDSTGAQQSGYDLLLRTLVLRRIFERKILAKDEKYVGILLPPTVPGAIANFAVSLSGRVAVSPTGNSVFDSCC